MNEQAGHGDETVALLAWYDENARDLPWRIRGAAQPDPYKVWLSEIMLQQTTVAAVRERFAAFVRRWPTVVALAGASLDDVLHEWQGLGYYARARNLHSCARQIVRQPGGARFPETEEALRCLPGIGDYTAAAIAAIAFGKATAPVDGNIVRVITRRHSLSAEMPRNRHLVVEALRPMVPADRPGDFAQALMDLGATVCKPRNPACIACPWRLACSAQRAGTQDSFPRKAERKVRPTRHGVVFWIEDDAGRVVMRRRPDRGGLLGGMMEFPSSAWRETPWNDAEALAVAGGGPGADWTPVAGTVSHTFTHFHLVLGVVRTCDIPADHLPEGARFVAPKDFRNEALPTVMRKIVRLMGFYQPS